LRAMAMEDGSQMNSFFYARCFANFSQDVTALIKTVAAHPKEKVDQFQPRTIDDRLVMHLYATGLLCAMLATRLGLGDGEIRAATEAGLLHDIGKKFTDGPDEERTHAQLSCEFLSNREFSRRTIHGIRDHHEHLDGSGHPMGKRADRIGTTARIVAICNGFDHFVNGQIPGKHPSVAIREMIGCGYYDKEMLKVFQGMVAPFFLGEDVMLSDTTGAYILGYGKDINDPLLLTDSGKKAFLSELKLSIASYDGTKKQKMILIVDDDPMILKQTKDILKEKYKVVCVTSGRAAVDFIKKIRMPNLILMDYRMPGMDGAFTVEMIREEKGGNAVPIVFLTGVTQSEAVRECVALRPSGYLVKPVKPEVLLKTCSDIISA
jgi:putative nucleotidyltransferase with HDIG domain